MAEFPPEMQAWQKRSQWFCRDFVSKSRRAKESLEALFKVANGDTSSSVITHWCLLPQGASSRACCESDEEAMYKFLSHAIYFFGRGFDTPLLYRLKHYGPASSFVKIGSCVHSILPRVLKHMDEINKHPQQQTDEESRTFIDSLLSDNHSSEGLLSQDFQALMSECLDLHENYAAQNGLRRKLVTQHLSAENFDKSANLIDSLINPMEYAVNFLISHTKSLNALTFVGQGHPKKEELMRDTQSKFLKVISGRLADELIQRYIMFLDTGLKEAEEMGLAPDGSLLNTAFAMALVCMADIHRRLKMEFRVPPFTLFHWMDLTTDDFVRSFSQLEAKFRSCPHCLDLALSSALMKEFAGLENQSLESQRSAHCEISALLKDISTFSAITSDLVELKNGQVQLDDHPLS